MIDPKDVMRRYSIEEFAQTAEQYYRVVEDPTPLMSKPFTFLNHAPPALHNLGQLLDGLQLGKTMTVLDFGAGTCWLSRFLIQLNCQVICCDVSATALAIGQRLFAEYPLIGTVVYTPTFLLFDGRRIDLPDESVDRIVCFDAFHHVPNPAETIRELGRVLKTGGIAGFSEPGKRHSRTPQSQYEMQNHKVLENDVDVNEIFEYARPAGFTRLSLKAAIGMEMSLDELNVLFETTQGPAHERLKSDLWNHTYNTMMNGAVFFLHKGSLARDSRSHIGLAHELRADRRDYAGRAGQPIPMSFTLKNTGEASWLHRNSAIFGIVRLASHLFEGDGNLITIDFSRHDLPRDMKPGDETRMTVEVILPRAGVYRLIFDLVAEGVSWFENLGSKPAPISVRVAD